MRSSVHLIVLLFSCCIPVLHTIATPMQSITSPLPARPGSKHITAEWLAKTPLETRILSSAKWLDNDRIIYSILPEGSAQKKIEIFNLTSTQRVQLGEGASPLPSPNSQWIVFLQENQLWLMKSDGTDRKQLTSFPKGLSGHYAFHYDFVWSPDSSKIALFHHSCIASTSPWQERDDTTPIDSSNVQVIDADMQKSHSFESEVYLINIKSSEIEQLANIDANIRDLSWFPNGEKLLFMKQSVNFYGKHHTSVETLSIKNRNIETLASFDGLQQFLTPTVSPDGKKIALLYDADNPEWASMLSVALISTEPNSTIKQLTHEAQMHLVRWSHDSSKIYAGRHFGPYNQINIIDANTSEMTQITCDHMQIYNIQLSPDNTKILWHGQDAHGNQILRIASSDGKNTRDFLVIPTAPKEMALGEVREIEWEVPNYPVPMRGLLFLPPNYQEQTRYPLVVDIHGGGLGSSVYLSGGILASTPLEWQLWTSQGYIVFVPEFRSSASFGSLAITRDENIENDIINKDIGDIIAGVDMLIAKGQVDANRMAAIGYSAGGRRANWLTVATHRFASIVSKEGWADDWLEYGIYQVSKKHPVLDAGFFQKNSALFHAQGATTPTLFLMGTPKLGGADPYDTVRWLFNALKAQGVKTKYIQYPNEGHGLKHPENRLDALQRTNAWITENMPEKGFISGGGELF